MHARAYLIAPLYCLAVFGAEPLPPNRWIEVARDAAGARPGSSMRYVPEAQAFFLWGFMNDDPELRRSSPSCEFPNTTWSRSTLRLRSGGTNSRQPGPSNGATAYPSHTYRGRIRASPRGANGPSWQCDRRGRSGAAPDLNVVFDQVVYCPLTPFARLLHWRHDGGL